MSAAPPSAAPLGRPVLCSILVNENNGNQIETLFCYSLRCSFLANENNGNQIETLFFYSLLSSPSSKIEQKVGKYAIMQLKAVSLQNTLTLQPARLHELTCCLYMRELCPALYFFALYRVLAFLVVK